MQPEITHVNKKKFQSGGEVREAESSLYFSSGLQPDVSGSWFCFCLLLLLLVLVLSNDNLNDRVTGL